MKNKHLKRAVVVRNAYRWQYGGAEQFAYNLGSVMKDDGVDVTVVTRVPELLKHCRRQGIKTFKNLWLQNETHRRWMPLYYLLYPLLVAQYAWVLVSRRADLLVVQSRDDQIFGTIAAKLVGVPVVWFDHADMKHIAAHPFRFMSKSYYWALERADTVIMTSKAEQANIDANLPKRYQSRFVLINNGALKGAGTAMGRPQDKQIVAYAGRLDKDKGLFDLVEAAAEVVKKVPQVEFWLAGKGPDESELQARIEKHKLQPHFRLLGHLDNVWDLLVTADIFVYPTHHDAAPLAPVEALLAGVPVVASKVGGIPEMVPDEAGLLVEPHQPGKLAGALVKLLGDEKRLAAMKAAARKAGPTMTFGHVYKEKYRPLFERLIGEKR
ncbi:MAG: sugar transporter permease [Candidatus Saccharibacteria bacterium]|jgi:glycosyltransferase involved in cell wall biosynthesis|nr:sugar transporter permease [Candidatus Saccharibacteria bacterium]